MIAEITSFLENNRLPTPYSVYIHEPGLQERIDRRDFDLLIALGGDGTMLRAGQITAEQRLPILGINMGRFGFLTEVKDEQWQQALEKILNGDYRVEERMMLRVEHRRGDSLLASWDALNELVVTRGYDVRPIQLQASVDGFTLARFIADGLIVATPTGSTAYALAAGGPIMPPELRNILIIPVAPHLSVDRAVILSQGAHVQVSASGVHPAVLSVDGHSPVPLEAEDQVLAYSSENMVSFIRFQDQGYFYRNLMMYMERNPSTGPIDL